MARYMVLWEIDTDRTPAEPKAKKDQMLAFAELTGKQIKAGIIKDQGQYAGEWSGFAIIEGSAVELQTLVCTWVPFVKFQTRQLMTIDEVILAAKALPES